MLVRAASSILSWGWGRVSHVLWSVGLSSYSRGLRGCWGHLLSPSGVLAACNRRWCRRAGATPRAATCSQCSARHEAAPPASVLKTPLPEVALASLDFTSFSFVWHCFSFNAKFSIVEDVELNYQLFSDIKAQTKYQNHNKILSFYVKSLTNQIFQSECFNSYIFICICGKSQFDSWIQNQYQRFPNC